MSARKGQRVELVHTSDPNTRLRPGDRGTVVYVDQLGTIHVEWDCGSSHGLVPGHDSWRIIGTGGRRRRS